MKQVFLVIVAYSFYFPTAAFCADITDTIICRRSQIDFEEKYSLILGPIEFPLFSKSGKTLGKIVVDNTGNPVLLLANEIYGSKLNHEALESTFGRVPTFKSHREVFKHYQIQTKNKETLKLQIVVINNQLLKYRVVKEGGASKWHEMEARE